MVDPKFKYPSILAKVIENKINDLSQKEIDRVFVGCASPAACKRGLHSMINAGLTMDNIRELSQQQMRLF